MALLDLYILASPPSSTTNANNKDDLARRHPRILVTWAAQVEPRNLADHCTGRAGRRRLWRQHRALEIVRHNSTKKQCSLEATQRRFSNHTDGRKFTPTMNIAGRYYQSDKIWGGRPGAG
jgi:hypothetical protein